MDIDQCACSGRSLDRFLRPAILAALQAEKSHGYDLVRRLATMDIFSDAPPDASGVYKTLRVMEKEGLVVSALDSGGGGGPARRSYALTPQGKACLRQWSTTLRRYREQLDMLLAMLPASARQRKQKNGS